MECQSDNNVTNRNGDTCDDFFYSIYTGDAHYKGYDGLVIRYDTICSEYYDTESYKVKDACCRCGGGVKSWNDSPQGSVDEENQQPLITVEVCFDTDTLPDSRLYIAPCGYYAFNNGTTEECGAYDSPFFNSSEMCCACGGGEIRSVRIPYPEPTCLNTNTRNLDGTFEEITDS